MHYVSWSKALLRDEFGGNLLPGRTLITDLPFWLREFALKCLGEIEKPGSQSLSENETGA